MLLNVPLLFASLMFKGNLSWLCGYEYSSSLLYVFWGGNNQEDCVTQLLTQSSKQRLTEQFAFFFLHVF